MKIISLFTKAPQHQKFSYRPRYYDPSKDEMAEREERIRKEIARERGELPKDSGGYKTRIAGSFQAARNRSKPTTQGRMHLLRLGILLYLTLLVFGFIFFGRVSFLSLIFIVPVYFYYKFKKIKKS